MKTNKLFVQFLLISTGFTALSAHAGLVSQDGLAITTSASVSGQTAAISFILDVGNSSAASSWIGTTMDSLSIQFGSAGKNSNTIIDSISSTATTSANVSGDWTGLLGKVSGNGCDGDDSETVCYTRLVTGTAGSSDETVMAANTQYSFMFNVNFEAGVNVTDVLAGNDHSIKFLSLKLNGNDSKWVTGDQLSKSGGFSIRHQVPEPGILALLAGGLLAMTIIVRRRPQRKSFYR